MWRSVGRLGFLGSMGHPRESSDNFLRPARQYPPAESGLDLAEAAGTADDVGGGLGLVRRQTGDHLLEVAPAKALAFAKGEFAHTRFRHGVAPPPQRARWIRDPTPDRQKSSSLAFRATMSSMEPDPRGPELRSVLPAAQVFSRWTN